MPGFMLVLGLEKGADENVALCFMCLWLAFWRLSAIMLLSAWRCSGRVCDVVSCNFPGFVAVSPQGEAQIAAGVI